MSRPVFKLQTRIVLSLLPETINRPSGEKPMDDLHLGSQDKTVRIWSRTLEQRMTKTGVGHYTTCCCSFAAYNLTRGQPSLLIAPSPCMSGHVSLWYIEHCLLWESDTPIQPINLLRLSPDRLIVSSPDGFMWTWGTWSRVTCI